MGTVNDPVNLVPSPSTFDMVKEPGAPGRVVPVEDDVAAPSPTEFTARINTENAVFEERPVMTIGEPVVPDDLTVQLVPPLVEYLYVLIVAPPSSAGAVKLTDSDVELAAVIEVMAGAPGTWAAGVNAPDRSDGLSPAPEHAVSSHEVTMNEYAVPLVRPEKVYEKTLDAMITGFEPVTPVGAPPVLLNASIFVPSTAVPV